MYGRIQFVGILFRIFVYMLMKNIGLYFFAVIICLYGFDIEIILAS